jgi:hypothetical protein
MTSIYVAKAAVVKVAVGPASGNRVARIIKRGGVIPEGVDNAKLVQLERLGLIELLPDTAADEAAAEAAVTAAAEAEAAAVAKAAADAEAAAALAKSKAAASAKTTTTK